MLSFTGLVQIAKNVLNLSSNPLCQHEYKPNGQIWTRIAPKKYQLKNRSTCTLCKSDRLDNIGEN